MFAFTKNRNCMCRAEYDTKEADYAAAKRNFILTNVVCESSLLTKVVVLKLQIHAVYSSLFSITMFTKSSFDT